ncbi:hypothetical protein AB6A40_002051 [Gnathostoma spinigerum]|uniref:non-specific serine/threonine protein kinase n=1 Tax=Gnathostoma spinigerum TaxID=75299 RepID=A0ABD6E7T4_9BILA
MFLVVQNYPFHAFGHLLLYISPSNDENENSEFRKKIVIDIVKKTCAARPSIMELFKNLRRAFEIFRIFVVSAGDSSSVQKVQERVMEPDCILMKELRFLRKIPIPAMNQPLEGDTANMIMLDNIEKKYSVAVGISRPMVITVKGSDGIQRKLIFKREDLRQDSLVQQLFSVVNILLSKRYPNHPLRTYHVVPLSSNVGIIEWCSKTQSLCEYLCGNDRKSGAHKQYYPNDITAYDARQQLHETRSRRGDLNATFVKICTQIHPVFRHFFYDRYFDPCEWREHINGYAISLAHWSIVGYVVGLGDRHLNNILIDLEKGQLVHIDLGMLFEFSRRNLPIPERVPFRLTRDMVDPILLEGVYGKFYEFAAQTMQNLRDNEQVLIGLALVLTHDPLSSFSDIGRKDHFSSVAVCRLREKLAGKENHVTMDAHQQISYLIKEATDPENLAQMFSGWMPFL